MEKDKYNMMKGTIQDKTKQTKLTKQTKSRKQN